MAADWTKMQLIDAVEESQTASGKVYQARYYVKAADLDFVPNRGDDATQIKAWWKVDEVRKVPISSTQYLVYITAKKYLNVTSNVGGSISLTKQFNVSTDEMDLIVTEPMLGVTKIQDTEKDQPIAGQTGGTVYYVALMKDADTYLTRPEWEAKEPEDCPFTAKPAGKYIGKTYRCMLATIIFYTSKKLSQIGDIDKFVGVNAMNVIPSKYGLPNRNTVGAWKAVGQKIDPVEDEDGDVKYYKITRQLQRVPNIQDGYGNSVRWDDDKHGGYFSW